MNPTAGHQNTALIVYTGGKGEGEGLLPDVMGVTCVCHAGGRGVPGQTAHSRSVIPPQPQTKQMDRNGKLES